MSVLGPFQERGETQVPGAKDHVLFKVRAPKDRKNIPNRRVHLAVNHQASNTAAKTNIG